MIALLLIGLFILFVIAGQSGARIGYKEESASIPALFGKSTTERKGEERQECEIKLAKQKLRDAKIRGDVTDFQYNEMRKSFYQTTYFDTSGKKVKVKTKKHNERLPDWANDL